MDLGLRGRAALVTGASRGIGLAVARALAEEGARVVCGARGGSAELDDLASRADVHPVLVDLATPEGPASLVRSAVEAVGDLDVLVNNVGAVTPRTEGFLAITDDDWERTLTLDLLAAVRTMRAAIPSLRHRPGSSIVTISSVNAYLPDPGVLDYSAAKAALTNVCKSLSRELAPGIRVNTVSPGPVRTDLWLGGGGVAASVGRASGATPEDVVARQEAAAATGRFTTPEEVADLVLFLASDRAGNTTGSDVRVDGGLVATV